MSTIYCEFRPNDLHIWTFGNFGKGTSGVGVLHIPTNIQVECSTERSDHANRHKALELLREKVDKAQGANVASYGEASDTSEDGFMGHENLSPPTYKEILAELLSLSNEVRDMVVIGYIIGSNITANRRLVEAYLEGHDIESKYPNSWILEAEPNFDVNIEWRVKPKSDAMAVESIANDGSLLTISISGLKQQKIIFDSSFTAKVIADSLNAAMGRNNE